ncbi:UDP-3-O-(3-hydroxymyristoyl)glucosamine N-acyltransferase [Pollutimonas subterranea]|uniref:UDP-3-O-(3-hydroxymyristoyl)glucosamine N-acyltransferase n=1 Tax=Pollutimonas subterranea TaxID=2045210 RepID=A0A2N4U986_9BURK|nr:DapH/DapD/GlmU-related protein [Pollutimonas subterranea]PLC51586.1 UDP-3-O-(3-hydroxymyristoyl)glucosamine N-acyltransferase [Pollutimonas subterranea]
MNEPSIRNVSVANVKFGARVTLVNPVNLYGCTLGDDVFVGPFVEIQSGVKIGNRSRIQSHAFVCELVEIGEDCFVSHGAKFVNDLFSHGGPARGNKALWMATRLGNRVSIGTNATVLPVQICDDVVVGAGAVVTRDIVAPGVYAGSPARKIRDFHDQIS